ncbi:MAG: hypothetical protein MRY83_03820, partial [Flavobacteriales bacterium]|nr:hypothetical protein [Flavobacteriales bacterium]
TYEIRDIINAMVPAGLMAEEWIRKKMFNNKSVDLRILIINKQASLVVPRISHHIITNLHLGNEKGNIEDLRNSWGDEVIDTAKREAIKAVEEIGGLFYAGVDVAIDPRGMPVILEVNAFGDMLLGIENNGLNSYDLELQEWLNQ